VFRYAAESRWNQAKTVLRGRTLDLSLGGALVQSNRAFPSGTPVTVSLELDAGASHLRSGARVIRTIGTDCMGIQFENLGSKRKQSTCNSSSCR